MRISASSIEYVKVPVAAIVNGAAIDPSTDVVALAFVAGGNSADPPSTWHTGSWEDLLVPDVETGATHAARVLVGTTTGGGVVLAAGSFGVWVKVTDSPEVPIRYVGRLEVV